MSETNSGSSRREFVTTLGAVAAASIALPILTGNERKASAADADGEWIATVKPEDFKDEPYILVKDKFVDGEKKFDVVLARKENTIFALSNKCTHKACKVVPGTGENKAVLVCPCHKGQFDYQGNPVKAPPTLPLARHAIRLNKDGVIEVNVSDTVGQDAGSMELKK